MSQFRNRRPGLFQSVSAKILSIQAISFVAMIVIGIAGYHGMTSITARLHSVHFDRVVPLIHLKEISTGYAVDAVRVASSPVHGEQSWAQALAELQAVHAEI